MMRNIQNLKEMAESSTGVSDVVLAPDVLLELIAENERLQRFETAYKEFSDKTDWVRPNAATHELGMHVADILRKRCSDLTSHNQAQADEIMRLRSEVEDGLAVLRTQKQQLECYIKDAERFRHLMFNHVDWARNGEDGDVVMLEFGPYPSHKLRESIDAAIAKEQQP